MIDRIATLRGQLEAQAIDLSKAVLVLNMDHLPAEYRDLKTFFGIQVMTDKTMGPGSFKVLLDHPIRPVQNSYR